MKMVRISDALADRLDAVRDRIAQENSVMSVTRSKQRACSSRKGSRPGRTMSQRLQRGR